MVNVDIYKLFVVLASHRIRHCHLHHRLHFVRNHIQLPRQLPRHILHVIVHRIHLVNIGMTLKKSQTKTDEYTLFNVTSNSQPPLYVNLSVNNVPLAMEVDTGAAFSVISKQTHDKFVCIISTARDNCQT